MAASKRNSSTAPPVHVGDRVRFKFGIEDVEGVVVEDRGPLGGGGRHLYRITFRFEYGEDMATELLASEFVVVKPASKKTDESGKTR